MQQRTTAVSAASCKRNQAQSAKRFRLPPCVQYDDLQWPTATSLRCAIITHLGELYGDRLRSSPPKTLTEDDDGCLSLASPTSVALVPEIIYAPTSSFVVHFRGIEADAGNRPRLEIQLPAQTLKLGPQELENLLSNTQHVDFVEIISSEEGIQNWGALLNDAKAQTTGLEVQTCPRPTLCPTNMPSSKNPAPWSAIAATP